MLALRCSRVRRAELARDGGSEWFLLDTLMLTHLPRTQLRKETLKPPALFAALAAPRNHEAWAAS